MKIVRDSRPEEFKRIEQLLYGINYEVWLNLYGPANADESLEQALSKLVAENCKVSGIFPSSAKEAKREIVDKILYEGDTGSGPIDLESKKHEVAELMNNVFSKINLEKADMVVEFGFKKGQPSYPVFWDFAYDIHSSGKRWILVGSSSD